MKDIAYKSKSAIIALILGTVAFIVLAVLALAIRPRGWVACTIVTVVFAVLCLVSSLIDIKRPNCLIKLQDNLLWINYQKHWYSIEITQLIDVKFRRAMSRTILLRSGSLTIITTSHTYKLYNVKNVQSVALILHDLILINKLNGKNLVQ